MRSRLPLLAPLLLLAWPSAASAGGLELLPGGTRSVARAGAVAARPEDPMVLLHNPAGLSLLSGEQVMLDLDLPIHDMCVDPYGYYGWGVYTAGETEFGDQLELDDPDDPTIGATYATTPLPEVCNSAPIVPIPHMAWATRIGNLGLGVGFVAPTVVAGMQWGGSDGTVQTEYGPRPTPTRYQLIKQEVLFALAPSFGVAYRFIPELAVGVNFQLIMLRARTWAVQRILSGTHPSTDMLAQLEAEDYFIPGLTSSVHLKPIEALDLSVTFRWVDKFSGPGKATFETRTYYQGATEGPVPFENDPAKLANVEVGLPYALTAGVRYAGLRRQFEDDKKGPGDPMDRELWDVELDFTYNFNEQAGASKARVEDDLVVISREVGGGGDSASANLTCDDNDTEEECQDKKDLANFEVERNAKDSIAVRLGGSYAITPRELALHGGLFYESAGVEKEYINIDSFALARVGAGIGVMWRLGPVDLTAGYSHIFQETLELAPPLHQDLEDVDPDDPQSGFDKRVGGSFSGGRRVGGVVLEDPDAPDPDRADGVAALTQPGNGTEARPNRIINAGRYTANWAVVSLGFVYHYD